MRKLILTLALITISTPAFAVGKTVTVDVNGLVCDFCARSIEKIFSKQAAVENVNVNLDDKIVTIGLKDGQELDDETITKLITDSGYDVEKISRNEE